MPKYPFMQFCAKEWLSDPQVSQCKPSTRGIWWDAVSAMHEMDRCGQLSGTLENLARVCRCRVDEMRAAIDDLRSTGAADVSEKNGVVTLTNRRMRRDAEVRHLVKNRVDRYRDKKRGGPEKRARNAPETEMKRRFNRNQNQKALSPTPFPEGKGMANEESFAPLTWSPEQWSMFERVNGAAEAVALKKKCEMRMAGVSA